jgi:hypothetical protein
MELALASAGGEGFLEQDDVRLSVCDGLLEDFEFMGITSNDAANDLVRVFSRLACWVRNAEWEVRIEITDSSLGVSTYIASGFKVRKDFEDLFSNFVSRWTWNLAVHS